VEARANIDGVTPSAADDHPLDNAVWHALGTRHAELAETKGRARRYPTDVSVFAGVDVLDDGGWDDLRSLAGPSAAVALTRPEVPDPPPGWRVLRRGQGHQLTLSAGASVAVDPVPIRQVSLDDLDEVLALIALTEPGPFAERTIEMGRYWGHFDDRGALLAMAGERMHLDGWTEISAVCTHPDARGRGLGAALTAHAALAIVGRGETPILHVRAGNESALRMYRRLGFTERRTITFAFLETPPDPA
jgi:ribosomal protein S18 acetylase RimI-like enzyme